MNADKLKAIREKFIPFLTYDNSISEALASAVNQIQIETAKQAKLEVIAEIEHYMNLSEDTVYSGLQPYKVVRMDVMRTFLTQLKNSL